MSPKPERLPSRSANIFVNYRRDDSAGHAGRLFDRLSSRFPGRVFMDVDTIEPGIDFADIIEQAVGCCEVLIVVIGREWLRLTDASGRPRLENPNDFVRLEIGTALQRNIRVIPVLVEGAQMPRPEDLPPDLSRLTRRNAIELSDARWSFDVDRLIQTIEGVLLAKAPSALMPPASAAPPEPARGPMGRRVALVLLTLVALGLVGWVGWRLGRQPADREGSEVAAAVSPQATPPAETSAAPPAPAPPPQEQASPAVSVQQPPAPAPLPAEEPAPEPALRRTQGDAPQPPEYGPDTCKKGFVWREIRPGDRVCVTPETRRQVLEDNRLARSRRDPSGGKACRSGYVWREAFEGDHVCVPPESRDQAHVDNAEADERRMKTLLRLGRSLTKNLKERGRDDGDP